MIVPENLAQRILNGQITQVRIPRNSRRCPHTIGRPVAIQPHSVDSYTVHHDDGTTTDDQIRQTIRSIGHALVIDIRSSTLADTTPRDLRREGYTDKDELLDAWNIHRRTRNPDTLVWVLTVKPHTDPIRIPAPSGSLSRVVVSEHHEDDFSGPEHDYVSSSARAMPGEPEAVDEFTQARITARANMETDQWRALDTAHRETRALDDRLREALMLAEHGGVDVHRQVASIRQRIQALERLVIRKAA